MTANKRFKQQVRARMRRTGESYTAALRHLRQHPAEESVMTNPVWRRVPKPEFDYAVWVPDSWDERPPNLKNSPWETARFGEDGDRRHLAIVFRSPAFQARTPVELADRFQGSLAGGGFDEFTRAEAAIGGRAGIRLDCVRRDAGRVWAVREYLVPVGEVTFCLGLGSAVPDEDAELFDELARRWELVEST